jgi:hypothetical protein
MNIPTPHRSNSSTTDHSPDASSSSLRELVPECWYEKAAGLKIATLKKGRSWGHLLSIDPIEASAQLDEIKAQGFQAVEIFAPAHGLYAYSGLDTIDHYQIDPELGTMDDFRQLVRIAHSKALAVIVFINIGYFSIEAPDWIEACKDKKVGRENGKADWFLWSNQADTAHPPTQEDSYISQEEREKSKDTWGWFYADAAGCYYWARWFAHGPDNKKIPLPQINWASAGWRTEAGRIVRFWMDTGIDGMLIDAPLCYPYQTWEHNRQIVDLVMRYGNTLLQPEGGREAAWMTECSYNCIQDYGFFYKPGTRSWGGKNILVEAIKEGNSREIEPCLRFYHDEMIQAGAVLYARTLDPFDGRLEQRHLQLAILAGIGDIIAYAKMDGDPDTEETAILHLKAVHPALYPVALRQVISTDAGEKCYAFLKTARDRSERILCVYNLQPIAQTVQLQVMVIDAAEYVDLRSGEILSPLDSFHPVTAELAAYGYRFFAVLPSGEPRSKLF